MEEVLGCPAMWGSLESVESMLITLLEVRAAFLDLEGALTHPRRTIDAYIRQLALELGSPSSCPLHVRVPEEEPFVEHMRAIVAKIISDM